VSEILSVCSCGIAWSASAWAKLKNLGVMSDGGDGWLELRNCTCGSTLSIEVEPIEIVED